MQTFVISVDMCLPVGLFRSRSARSLSVCLANHCSTTMPSVKSTLSLLSVVGGVGYNSTGLVEGLAHQTHLQHVNDDGKEVVCVHGHLWSWHLGQLTDGNQHTGQHRRVPT